MPKPVFTPVIRTGQVGRPRLAEPREHKYSARLTASEVAVLNRLRGAGTEVELSFEGWVREVLREAEAEEWEKLRNYTPTST